MKRSSLSLRLLKKMFPSRFILAKLTNYPVIGPVMDKVFFKEDDLIYLPKERHIELNTSVELHDNIVLPSKLVEHYIEEADYHWVMDFCICRESNECEDYPIELGCLFLGEAARDIDSSMGREVTKKEALEHVEKCREAGLVHLIGRNELDSVWLDVRPGEKLMTVCNCCPCCCLWKMIPDLSPSVSTKIKRLPGLEIKVNDKCIGCGKCVDICFINAVKIKNGNAVISEDCRGCGRCAEVCPEDAIEMILTDEDFFEKSIENLDSALDI